jgi:hypothetical protein
MPQMIDDGKGIGPDGRTAPAPRRIGTPPARAFSIGACIALLSAGAPAAEPAPAAPPPPKPIRSDWYLRYEPLEDGAARRLLDAAIAFGRERLGEPAIAIRTVHLRRSIPIDPKSDARRGFQLTEIADSEKGAFAIYLSAAPGDTAFEGQIAHEAFHLFDARLRDAYVEGLNGLLSEDLFRARGLDWEPWLRHFREGREPLYGSAYFLVKELAAEVGREPLWKLLRFAVETPGHPDRSEIDIDRWLDSLGPERSARARAVIGRRFEEIEKMRRKDQPELALRKPRSP